MEDNGQNENGKGNEKLPIKPPPENNNNLRQPPPSQPPQQCPRCDSFNTKFCYYNNYSQSQPRYFCKSCRRYWTQGGTLRNVPIGGGSRKAAKRLVKMGQAYGNASCSSSSMGESSRSVQEQVPAPMPPPPLPPPPQQPLPSLSAPPMRSYSSMGLSFPNSLYSPSELLTAFTALQSLNGSIGFTQQLSLNGGGGGDGGIPSGNSSNYSVLQGFSSNSSMLRAPQVLQQTIYRSQEAQMNVVHQPNRPLGDSWIQGFINNNPSSSSTTNVSWAQSMLLHPNNNINGHDSAINNLSQWPNDDVHLPSFRPPSPPS